MEKRIQKIINNRIKDKVNQILYFKESDLWKDKRLTLIVDEENINSSYIKSIKQIFKKYFSEDNLNFVVLDKNMSKRDLYFHIIDNVDNYGYLFIQPSITGNNKIDIVQQDLDKLHNDEQLWNKNNLTITAQVIGEIIEDYVKDINNPNIVIIGDGITVGRPLNLWCQQQKYWNTYQIKECFKEKEDELDVYENGLNLKYKLLKNADIIVSATGIPNSLVIRDKAVISPTIFYDERTQRFQNDLEELCRDKCDTHTVLNSIGTLTNLELCIRWLSNVLGIDNNDRFNIGK